jgi:hypothetical protein
MSPEFLALGSVFVSEKLLSVFAGASVTLVVGVLVLSEAISSIVDCV